LREGSRLDGRSRWRFGAAPEPFLAGSRKRARCRLAIPAAQLGLDVHAFTVALQRLRRRLGDRLRARVAETLADPAETEAELRQLVEALVRSDRVM
jgi:hypothetical protein